MANNQNIAPDARLYNKFMIVSLSELNPEAMAEKAIELLRDNDLHERLSSDALTWAGEFNWDRSAEEFLKASGGYSRKK